MALGALLIGLIVLTFQVTTPAWYLDQELINDLVMFIAGLVFTLAVAAVAAEERRGRERLRVASAAVERARVGREVHDGLGHHLTAISVLLQKADAFRALDPAVADAAIRDARESSRLALKDVRRSVHALRTSEPFDLDDALSALAQGLRVTVTVQGDYAGFDDDRRLVLYRAAQEAITNALRHAQATHIRVHLTCSATGARLSVRDDGTGFTMPQLGWGLTGMRERVEGVGGTLEINSTAGLGTELAIVVPRLGS